MRIVTLHKMMSVYFICFCNSNYFRGKWAQTNVISYFSILSGMVLENQWRFSVSSQGESRSITEKMKKNKKKNTHFIESCDSTTIEIWKSFRYHIFYYLSFY